jgi:hypothetical protein
VQDLKIDKWKYRPKFEAALLKITDIEDSVAEFLQFI